MIKKRCNMTFLVMCCHKHWFWHQVMPMVSSMAAVNSLGQDDWNEMQDDFIHTNGINNGTWQWCQHKYSHWHKSHIIPLNNHLNKIYTMVSLMVPSVSCEKKHVIAMYVPKTNMPLQSHINHTCQSVHVHLCNNCVNIYASHEPNAVNIVTRNTNIQTFHIIDICLWTNMPVTLHIYASLHYYCGLHIDPTLL